MILVVALDFKYCGKKIIVSRLHLLVSEGTNRSDFSVVENKDRKINKYLE